MKVKIQPRDIQIMKFVFACRVVTYAQIKRRHFPKACDVVARRRIRSLVNDGYFKVGSIELSGKLLRTLQPTPALWPVIEKKWPFIVDTPHYKSESTEHDIRMTEIVMRLEKLKSYRSFYTENLLQSSSALIDDPRFRDLEKIQPDGVLIVEDQKGALRIYAVELELSRKSLELYRQKFIDYYLARGIDGVLYISSKRDIEGVIAKIDEEFSHDRSSIVRFAFEQNVVSGTPMLCFSNRKEPDVELS